MSVKLKMVLSGVLILISAAVIVFSLFANGVIVIRIEKPEPPYEPRYLNPETLGSARALTGRVGVVSIFASDPGSQWDMEDKGDKERIDNILTALNTACTYLKENASRYGVEVDIDYAKNTESPLFITGDFKNVVNDLNGGRWERIDLADFIKGNCDMNDKYDSVVYLFFTDDYKDKFDQDDYVRVWSFADYVYDKALTYPYEMCFLPYGLYESGISASVIAHEMMHCFGAPDLYQEDSFGINYGTSNISIEYVEENIPNEIMLIQHELGTEKSYSDRITNEISDITAYYIGWLPTLDLVDELKMTHSQHDLKKDP